MPNMLLIFITGAVVQQPQPQQNLQFVNAVQGAHNVEVNVVVQPAPPAQRFVVNEDEAAGNQPQAPNAPNLTIMMGHGGGNEQHGGEHEEVLLTVAGSSGIKGRKRKRVTKTNTKKVEDENGNNDNVQRQ